MKITPRVLRQVQMDNMSTHQFGDAIKDGISWDSEENPRFFHPDEVDAMVITPEAARATDQGRALAPEMGKRILSSAEQNAHAARSLSDHLARSVKQIHDPNLN